ncbi:hypothetical protein U8527_14160 [Kordia algicida OT-1]|uniref:Uncharacterized protein n=1 Tax=Kordia algicida OT-1 TaxID=391587 RepID=A9DXU7_9FLAO|nr:hypothetical protein [Kordia algicida]EDP96048.1 hypothetical protein KAOT1_07763 [Kordia algicida OT-1]
MNKVKIKVYNKKEKVTTTLYVNQLSKNKFRMIDNDFCNPKLTLGTEFETKINVEQKHEIIKITKESEFITRRFILTPNHKESDYLMIGEELTKRGGFWQVDLGSIATVNIPKDFEFDIDQVIKELDLNLVEITE